MNKKWYLKRLGKLLNLFVAFNFLCNSVLYGLPLVETTKFPINKPKISDNSPLVSNLFIPENFGSITKKFNSETEKSIICIQDAHCNYEVQHNISKILEILVRDYKVDLIAIEGAVGDIDLSRFGKLENTKVKEKVIDRYVRRGIVTGPEYLRITKYNELPFGIYGIENGELYVRNFLLFRTSISNNKAPQLFVDELSKIIEKLKLRIYSKDLHEFDNVIQMYNDNKISLADYIKYLGKMENVSKEKYPNINTIFRSIGIEERIDFKNLEKEKTDLVRFIEKNLPREELESFVKNSLLYKLGKMSSLDYYSHLEKYIPGNEMVNMRMYIHLVKLQSKIDNDQLFKEIYCLEASIKNRMFKNKIESQIDDLSKKVNILNKLFNLQLNREMLQYFQNHKAEFSTEALLSLIKIQAPINNIELPSMFDDVDFLKRIDEFIVPADKFYEAALTRDKVLVENTLEKMNSENKKIAVMITGGFHTEGITEILKEKNITHIVITPKITKPQDDCPYLSLMMDEHIKVKSTDIERQDIAFMELLGEGDKHIATIIKPLGVEEWRRLLQNEVVQQYLKGIGTEEQLTKSLWLSPEEVKLIKNIRDQILKAGERVTALRVLNMIINVSNTSEESPDMAVAKEILDHTDHSLMNSNLLKHIKEGKVFDFSYGNPPRHLQIVGAEEKAEEKAKEVTIEHRLNQKVQSIFGTIESIIKSIKEEERIPDFILKEWLSKNKLDKNQLLSLLNMLLECKIRIVQGQYFIVETEKKLFLSHCARGVNSGEKRIWLGEKAVEKLSEIEIIRIMLEEGLHMLRPTGKHDVDICHDKIFMKEITSKLMEMQRGESKDKTLEESPEMNAKEGKIPFTHPGTRKTGDGYILEKAVPESEKKYHLFPQEHKEFIDYLHETIGIIDTESSELQTTYQEIKKIVDLLLEAAGLNPEYFIFHLLDTPEVNAFILRYSNHIFLNIGLIDYIIEKGGTIDALAFVLAHEIIHIIQFRSDIDTDKAKIPKKWKDVIETRVSKYCNEYDADFQALKLLEKVYEITNGKKGFAISQASFLFHKLDEDRLETKFGTHPQIQERIRRLENIMNNSYWSAYFITPTPFIPEVVQEVKNKTRKQRFIQDIKEMKTLDDFQKLLEKVTNINELEYLIMSAYENPKFPEDSFRTAFNLANEKVNQLIKEAPQLEPYYLFIMSSLGRYTRYNNMNYEEHKDLTKNSLQKLSYEELFALLSIKLPPILETKPETQYFKYKYEFYGYAGSFLRDIRLETFMEIWLDSLMEAIEESIQKRGINIDEIFALNNALEMHRQRAKRVRSQLQMVHLRYFPGNREIFHVYNFDITWYLWQIIEKDPKANSKHIPFFMDKLKNLNLSTPYRMQYRQASLIGPNTERAERYQKMLDGLRWLRDQGYISKLEYFNFVINKRGVQNELASQLRKKEIEKYPNGDLLDFTKNDIDKDLEIFMTMFSDPKEYFSDDMLKILDKMVSYYNLSPTKKLDFIERAYKKMREAWFNWFKERDEEAIKRQRQESLYFVGEFHDYLRRLVFSLEQTQESIDFLNRKMCEIESVRNLSGLSSLSFEMKRLIYLYHMGSGIHPWTLKLVLFGRDEDNGHILTTYAIDFSGLHEREGLTAKEKQAKDYGRQMADKIEELIQGGARFWDDEKTLLQLTPEQLKAVPHGTVLRSIIITRDTGDYAYVTVGVDTLREDAKRKTFPWYDTFTGTPIDPFEYEYTSSSKMDEEKDRAWGCVEMREIVDHPLYGIKFTPDDLYGFYRFLASLALEKGPMQFYRMEDYDPQRDISVEFGSINTWDEYIAAIGIQSFLRRLGVETTNVGIQPRIFDAGEYDKVPSPYKAFVGELFELPGLEEIESIGPRSARRMAERYRDYHKATTPCVLLRHYFNDVPVDQMFTKAFGFIEALKGTLAEKIDYLVREIPPSVFRNFALYALFIKEVLKVEANKKGLSFEMQKAFEPEYIEIFIHNNFTPEEQINMMEKASLIMKHIVWDKKLEAANRQIILETAESIVRGKIIISNEFVKSKRQQSKTISDNEPEYVYIPDNFSSSNYTLYQYYIPGGVAAYVEFVIPHMFTTTLKDIFNDQTISFQDKLSHLINLYPRPSPVRDQYLDSLLATPHLNPMDIEKTLELFSNETLRQKHALKALELEHELYKDKFNDPDYELERILYYFPKFGYMRDDILNNFINRRVTHPRQLKKIQEYLLQFQDNVTKEEIRKRIFATDMGRIIFQDYFSPDQKAKFLLWVLGFSSVKPDFLVILEHEYQINFDSIREGTSIYNGKYYSNIGKSASEDILEMFLFGEKGILSDKTIANDFLNAIFSSIVPDSVNPKRRELLRNIFFAVFEHATEIRKGQILKRLFVAMKKLGTREKPPSTEEIEAIAISSFLESVGFIGVKLGQFLTSANLGLPKHIADRLAYLKEKAPSIDKSVAFGALEIAYGNFYDTFESLEEPLGSASIKIVYRAKLKNGQYVVVKLKRPDVEKRIEEELDFLKSVLDSIQNYLSDSGIQLPKDTVSKVQELIMQELNFEQEAENQKKIRANIERRDNIGIPKFLKRLIKKGPFSIYIPTAKVLDNLVMQEELVDGVSLNNDSTIRALGISPDEAKKAAIEELLKEIFIDGEYHADPHAGNILVDKNYRISFIDLGLIGTLSVERREIILKLIIYAIREKIPKILHRIIGMPNDQDVAILLGKLNEGQSITINPNDVIKSVTESKNPSNRLLNLLKLIENAGGTLPTEIVTLNKTLATAEYLFNCLTTYGAIRVFIEILFNKRKGYVDRGKNGDKHTLHTESPDMAVERPPDVSDVSSVLQEFSHLLGLDYDEVARIISMDNDELVQKLISILKSNGNGKVSEDDISVVVENAEIVDKILERLKETFKAKGPKNLETVSDRIAIYLAIKELSKQTELPEFLKKLSARLKAKNVVDDEMVDKIIEELFRMEAFYIEDGEIYRSRFFDLYLQEVKKIFQVEEHNECNNLFGQLVKYKFIQVFAQKALKAGGVDTGNVKEILELAIDRNFQTHIDKTKVVNLLARFIIEGKDLLSGIEDKEKREKITKNISDYLAKKGLANINWEEELGKATPENLGNIGSIKGSPGVSNLDSPVLERLGRQIVLGKNENDVKKILSALNGYMRQQEEFERNLSNLLPSLDELKNCVYMQDVSLYIGEVENEEGGYTIQDTGAVGVSTIRMFQKNGIEQIFIYENDDELEAFKRYLDMNEVEYGEGKNISFVKKSTESYHTVKSNVESKGKILVSIGNEKSKGYFTGDRKDRIVIGEDIMLLTKVALLVGTLNNLDEKTLDGEFREKMRSILRGYYKNSRSDEEIEEYIKNMITNGIWFVLPPISPFVRAYYNTLKTTREIVFKSA